MWGWVLALLLLLVALPAHGQGLASLAFEPHPGAALPLDAPLRDEAGRDVTLRGLLGKPLVLALGYFRCPNLCGTVRDDALAALDGAGLRAGTDYRLVVLSIDKDETPADAAKAKGEDQERFPGPGSAEGWRYLTGPGVAAVADAVGFRFRPGPGGQFAHPAGLVVATPGGVVSGYLGGVGYEAAAVRDAVARAAAGGEADVAAQPVVLLCFHYDPATGRYTLAVTEALRLLGLVFAVLLGGGLLFAHARSRAREG